MTSPGLDRGLRFDRQLRIPEIAPEGQKRIENARVLVVGCGALGAPVIAYLASAGVGRLTLVDGDVVELSNLNRQILFADADLGLPKAERACAFARNLDPVIQAEPVVDRFSVHNGRALVRAHDLVVDCTDALPSKYLVHDASVLERVPLIHGAVTAFSGQVLVVPAGGRPCLRCLFPSIPGPGAVPTCQEAGALGAAAGVVGALMATSALRALIDKSSSGGRFLSLDLLSAASPLDARTLTFAADSECPVCGDRPSLDAESAADYEPESLSENRLSGLAEMQAAQPRRNLGR
jgi:adenylyltransferase/sulfurtransferase